MTTREELKTKGFHFFCFSKREARETFAARLDPEDFACVPVDEVHGTKKFELFFLGVRKLHHVPVKFTPPLGGR